MKYCTKCLFPDTKPNLTFDEKGVCAACKYIVIKNEINWEERKEELKRLLDKHKSKDGANWDCIVPVSGGKDSHFQAWYIKSEFGINPLLVNFRPRDQTPLGRKNLDNLISLGFDCIELVANPEIYLKLAKYGLEELGDIAWPEHMGLFACSYQIAVKYDIKLVIWGENAALEYGGPEYLARKDFFDKAWDDKHGAYFQDKIKGEDMVKHGFTLAQLKPFIYPPNEEIRKVEVIKANLGSFVKWDARKHAEISEKIGFTVGEQLTEGTYTNYENLDTRYVGLHDYFKWLKYGFGRATDHASIDIRNKRITREEGLKLVKQYEGKIPTRYLDEFYKEFGYTTEEFLKICEKFTNKDLFKCDENGNLIRDEHDNIEKIKYDN